MDLGATNSKGARRVTSPPAPSGLGALWRHFPRRWLTRAGMLLARGLPGVNPLPFLPPSRVSPAGCDMCADNRNGECPMHGPLHSLRRLVGTSSAAAAAPPPELPEWLRDLPREVCLCTSTVPGLAYGICAAQRIQQGTWIGPFQGVLLPPEKVQAGAVRNTQHLWEVSRPPPRTLPLSWSFGRQRASLVPQRVVEARFLWSRRRLVFAAPAVKRCRARPSTTATQPGRQGLQVSEDGITITSFHSSCDRFDCCLPWSWEKEKHLRR